MEKPKYQHDCGRCTFLGTYYDQKHEVHNDLYHCDQNKSFGPTLVARWGPEGWQYSSGLLFALEGEPGEPLHEAYLLAQKQNLNLKKPY